MKIYEKAIKNYIKSRRNFYNAVLKQDVHDFKMKVKQMVSDGRCGGFECSDCPIRLAHNMGVNVPSCGVSTPQEVREIITRRI